MLVSLFALAAAQPLSAAEDARIPVKLPQMMRDHMLGNMRDHLLALQEIHEALGNSDYDRAADVAEQRIGMSSLASHDASHMAPFMPKGMQNIGTEMHHAASRFARVAGEPAVEGHLARTVAALGAISRQCVACHAAYRLE